MVSTSNAADLPIIYNHEGNFRKVESLRTISMRETNGEL